MDATELQLRRRISTLEERCENLEQLVQAQTEKIEEIDSNFNERMRAYLVSYGVIEAAAEDE